MGYLDSCGIIHRDLNPANAFGNWERITDRADKEVASDQTVLLDTSYTVPERFKNPPTLESGIFSFGLILGELLPGKPGFSHHLSPRHSMKRVVLDNARPSIPGFLCNNEWVSLVEILFLYIARRDSLKNCSFHKGGQESFITCRRLIHTRLIEKLQRHEKAYIRELSAILTIRKLRNDSLNSMLL
jgi:serine/threonine protein kinase